MKQRVPDPRPDDRPRHGPDGDEQQVVRSKAIASRDEGGQHQRRGDGGGERDGLPAHDEAFGQAKQGVEVERDDGDRHGAEQCIRGVGTRPSRGTHLPAGPSLQQTIG